jgi:predicted alpha/beta-hydrolase family hydrolase
MDSEFMEFFARQLAAPLRRVARFEFPYMAKRRTGQGKPGPDREPTLRVTWQRVIETFIGKQIVIGGKSMGGRIASLMVDQSAVAGLVCFGYPFHPPGKPERLRTAHLETLTKPCLLVQGTRDPFGTREEVEGYPLSPKICLAWMEDGDHSLVPRKASGRTQQENWLQAVRVTRSFLDRLT